MAQVLLDRSECDRDGKLPPVCLKCGAGADCDVERRFSWCPSWVVVFILLGVLGLLLLIVLTIVLTKRMRVYVPLCEEHRGYFRQRKLISNLILLAGLGALASGIGVAIAFSGPGNDWAIAFGFGGFGVLVVALIVAAVFTSQGVRATEITDYEVRLSGVSEGFADALRDQRRAQRRVARDDEDDRPRGRRRSRYDEEDD